MFSSNSSRKWIVALTTMLGTFMEVLDTSVANVALPQMKGSYAAGTDEITWVITSYLVANAIILPITGWLGAAFGRKRLYLTCLAIFTLSSFGAGAAPTLGIQIIMRVIQGLSGGAMVPMSQAITLEVFPKEEHGIATAVFGIGVILGPILGPLVGGWITDNWSWPWIFYINIPVGILAYFLASTFIEDPPYLTKPEGKVDGWSLAFIAVGLGCLELFLSRGERLDWFESNTVKLFFGFALLGLALFIWRSLTAKNPLVNLSMFKLPEFAGGMALIFTVSLGLYGCFILLPLYMQGLLGFTPTWAGIVLSPGGVASVVAMLTAGILMGRVHIRYIVGAGIASLAYSAYLLTHISLTTDLAYLIKAWIFHGAGLGLVFVPIATSSVRRIKPEMMGVASGMFNLMRNEGGSVGIAVATTLLQTRSQVHHSYLTEHVTSYAPAAQVGLQKMTAGLAPTVGRDPHSLQEMVKGAVGLEVARQSFLLSFVDVFAFLTIIFILAFPLLATLRKVEGGGLNMGH